MERSLAMDVQGLANIFVRLDVSEPSRVLACVMAQSSLLERIKSRQFDILTWMIYVPNVDGLRELILEKAHSLRYSIHPSVTKMYYDLKRHYWWQRMKKDIFAYVSWCLNCQHVKYEHKKPGGLI
ncbi:uncharacterized protein [Nicotiana tomentosiformis]|uniref:uncharacterized protein n=1 Tax=Nicotiana tomentosiformis TaxID=4098 RepID=UPI00388CD2D5